MLPFTTEQFFQVFVEYNRTVWPAQWLLWLAGAAALAGAIVRPRLGSRIALIVLACLWLWMAFAYHLAFFARINPLARVFAVVFAAEGLLLAWRAARRASPELALRRTPRDLTGLAFALFGLVVYPLLNSLFGHRFPAAPGFGLPCPTTLFTLGILTLGKPRADRLLLVVPTAWSMLGLSAALNLGVRLDLSLVVAAAWGVWLIARPAAPTGRPIGSRERSDRASARR